MSRKVVLGAAVLVVSAYVAASWGLGRATHARFEAYAQQWNNQPMALIEITEHKYTPGIFSSEERITFALNKESFGNIFRGKNVDRSSPAETLQVTILNKVQHGPLPGFRSFGLARIETSLDLSEAARAKVAEVIGDKDPLLVTTVHGFTGAGSSTVTSPAFEFEADGTNLSWKGFEGAFSYGRDLSSVECDLSAPGMDFTAQNGAKTQMGEISFDCDLERAFDDLYVGTAALTLVSLHHSNPKDQPMKIERITYATDFRKADDYVDMGFKIGIENIELKDIAMSNLRYDIALNHVHGPTYSALQRRLKDVAATGAPGDPIANLTALESAFSELLPQFLEHSPQFVIEHIGFSMPEGEAGLKAILQLDNFTKEDMASGATMALLGKLNASADLWVSEGLLRRDWNRRASDTTGEAGNATDKLAMMQMQVAQLEQQGYLQREGDRLESHIVFKNGTLSANGKPIGAKTQGM